MRQSMLAMSAAILITLVAHACSDQNNVATATSACYQPGRITVTPDDFNETRYETNELWRFGNEEGQELGFVTSVAASSGPAFAADPMSGVVHRIVEMPYAAIGKRGEGPGEFLSPVEVSVSGDTLFVFDTGLWRLTSFSLDGDLIHTYTLVKEPDLGDIPDVKLAGNNVYTLVNPPNAAAEFLEAQNQKGPVRVAKTLLRWTPDAPEWSPLTSVAGPEAIIQGSIRDAPFGNRPLWGVSHDGSTLWYADTKEFALRRMNTAGSVTCEVDGGDFIPDRIAAAARDSFYAALDIPSADPDRRASAREARKALPLPEHRPLLRELVVTETGGLLVSLEREAQGNYLVLSSQGTPLGKLSMPLKANIVAANDSVLVGIVRDSLDVQSIVAWQFYPSAGSE